MECSAWIGGSDERLAARKGMLRRSQWQLGRGRACGNWEEAVRIGMKRLRDDPDLFESVVTPLVEWAVMGLVQKRSLDRKKYEIAQHPEFPLCRIHKRALRYMEKRFLRDLWVSAARPTTGSSW